MAAPFRHPERCRVRGGPRLDRRKHSRVGLAQRGLCRNAERLGIFIGLWAPTFMLIGNALKSEEMTGIGRRLQQAVEPSARKLEHVAGALGDETMRGARASQG